VPRIKPRLRKWRRRLEQARLRRWHREDGPGPVLRWSCQHPWLVTGVIAALLTVVLGLTFGIPPLSPLFLVFVFVAPIPWWLRAEHRIYQWWRDGQPPEGSQ